MKAWNGKWDRGAATHLLWRAQNGASAAEIDRAVEDGLEKTLGRLFEPQDESAEFVEVEEILREVALDTDDINRLKEWWLYRMLYSANPLVERMALFWHNHFATSNAKVRSVEHMLVQNELIRGEALGSFRKLLSGMTRDVAMLIWLDGNANRKRHPNENFAREVMELFSLGVGNYTEEDIREAARAFTGWHLRGEKFWLNKIQHDTGEKNVLGKRGKLGGDDVVDICLEQKACPRFLATKLLRAFVTEKPTDGMVDALAGRIRAHDFAMGAALRELFGSEMFFAEASRHAVIKSPVALVIGAFRALEGRANLEGSVRVMAELGQNLFEPPTVKGWEGGRLWINSTTLLQRRNFAAELVAGKRFGEVKDLGGLAPRDAGEAAQKFVELLLARELDDAAIGEMAGYLKEADGSRDVKCRGVVQLILSMPEFQLI